MLVLSRGKYEEILIGDDIVVSVQRIGTDHVRIGIVAPENVNIVRRELVDESRRSRKPTERTQED